MTKLGNAVAPRLCRVFNEATYSPEHALTSFEMDLDLDLFRVLNFADTRPQIIRIIREETTD